MSTRVDAAPRLLRLVAVILALLAFTWALAGCTSGSSDSSGGADGDAPGVGAPEEAGGGDAFDRDDAAADPLSGDRSIIVTGAMYMTVDDPIVAADKAARIVEDAGGRVDSRRETAPTEYDGGSARLTLRIPADGLDAVVDDLRALGTVDEFSTNSSDVTREVTDLAARIDTLRDSTARIQALLGEAEDITDIITLENELDRRQAELESLEARQRGLDDLVSMSTIDLSLTTEPIVIVDDSPRTFLDGLASGWNGLVEFFTGALVVTGVLLPWLAAVALVGAVAFAVYRATRTRRAHAADASSDATPEAEEPAPASKPTTLQRD